MDRKTAIEIIINNSIDIISSNKITQELKDKFNSSGFVFSNEYHDDLKLHVENLEDYIFNKSFGKLLDNLELMVKKDMIDCFYNSFRLIEDKVYCFYLLKPKYRKYNIAELNEIIFNDDPEYTV